MKHIIILFLSIVILSFSGPVARADYGEANEVKVDTRDMDRNDDGKITSQEWQEAFRYYDWNDDGVLSDDEVKAGARRSKGASNDSRDQFRVLDLDRNNVITPSEWAGTLRDFNSRDEDRSGELSVKEFHQRPWLDQFGELDHNGDGVVSDAEWHKTNRSFAVLDLNGDGALSRDEFYNEKKHTVSVFRELDANNDGKISAGEWRNTNEAFSRLDTNEDKFLSENEFNARHSESIISQLFQDIFSKR